MLSALFVFLGACIGSFLCVVAERTALKKSWLWNRSQCLQCGRFLPWYETIPLLSYVCLRGRCRGCGVRISCVTACAEWTGAVLFLIVFHRFGFSSSSLFIVGVGSILLLMSCTDALEGYIYDRHILMVAVFSALLCIIGNRMLHWSTFIGLIGWGCFAFCIGRRMGDGDKILIAVVMVGMPWYWQWRWLLYSVWSAFFPALILLFRGHSKKTAIPFVPFLFAGYLLLWMFPGSAL